MSHHCHALGCDVPVPPRMHMHKAHWAMVPRSLQRELWAAYRPGQERDKQPSPRYLRAAAACIRAVAEREGYPEVDIAREESLYLSWAEMLEADDEQGTLDLGAS